MSIKTPDSELVRAMSREWLANFMKAFGHSIRNERASARIATAAFVDGLAGVTALAIAGRHGSKDEIVEAAITQLRESIDRDLQHLFGG